MWQTGAYKMPIYSCHWIAAWKVFSYGKYFFVYRKFRRFTMIPAMTYVRNLALAEKYGSVPGAIVECGVWKGGMIAGILSILGSQREYYLFDSFAGLPEAKPIDGDRALRWQANKRSQTYHDNCKATVDFAEQDMRLAGVEIFHAIQGWFEESLAVFKPSEPIAALRLDADWFGSILTCLRRLYPLVAHGGLIILDHYYTWNGCERPLHEFLVEASLTARIRQYDNDVCFVVKRLTAAGLPVKINQDATDSRQVERGCATKPSLLAVGAS